MKLSNARASFLALAKHLTSLARANHYVPIWYQKGFFSPRKPVCLDLQPDKKILPDGRTITNKNTRNWLPKKCFVKKDLYTTAPYGFPNDGIEKYLFGIIDGKGAPALRAVISGEFGQIRTHFEDFFEYLDAQKLRTPKGLDWLKLNYPKLTQLDLMVEMQAIRRMHCTMWVEAVREIVSAKISNVKFIVTDHPVTVYNPACPPTSSSCIYPNDPDIGLVGSQTIFPLDHNNCLILTNLEYAKNPSNIDPLAKRTHARHFGQTIARTDTMIRTRTLTEEEVTAINYILKSRALRYVAASEEKWLYPERTINHSWAQIGKILLPPKNELWHFGGETYVGKADGSVIYQDAFGRRVGANPYLKKNLEGKKIGANDPCICGSGKKFKKCCRDRPKASRPIATERSIRERNLMLHNGICRILGLDKGKTWDDVRRDFGDSQVRDIHGFYGSLWPPETNILDLLPFPEEKIFRTLYMGIIDPRVILHSVAGFSFYSDEILVMNPFTNPAARKPEFSPTESPTQFRFETLKNVFLLEQLIPLIDAGVVNFIPNPMDFNPALRDQIFSLAKERRGDFNPKPEYLEKMEALSKNDFQRIMICLPDHLQARSIKELYPDLSEKQIADQLENNKRMREKDPLALLSPIPIGKEGGQICGYHLSPNYELGMFLAHVTGSIPVTDDPFRWGELLSHMSAATKNAPWDVLTRSLDGIDLTFEMNPFMQLEMRRIGKGGAMKKALRDIIQEIQTEPDAPSTSSHRNRLLENLREAQAKTDKDFLAFQKVSKEGPAGETDHLISKRKMRFVISQEGFSANTVHRLLLVHGRRKQLKTVRSAFFIEDNGGTVNA